MSAPLTVLLGLTTAAAGGVVLAGWAVGSIDAARVVAGWRVMVPSSAFSFVAAGSGIAALGLLGASRTRALVLVRLLAGATAFLPVCTLLEHAFGVRWRVESWLGFSYDTAALDPYAGRMSPMASVSILLLGIALGALTWPGLWPARLVRLAGGAALTMSWLAVVAVSFEAARLDDVPQFPGMAVLTIALLATSSVAVLLRSTQAMARLRDADADAVLAPRLLIAAFLLPLVLGRAQALLARALGPELATALVTAAFAVVVSVALWRGAAHMQSLRRQRRLLLEDLEARVADRTRELAITNTELQRSEERLREADRRKDEFLATLAHELRNPLAPIMTGIELLKGEALPPEGRTRAHEIIARQMRHLLRLIDDLLDVSRITADKLTLHVERLDFAEIVSLAVQPLRDAIDRAGHVLIVDLPADPIPVEGDPTRLTQVVANLVQNACKYTPPGGRIEVSAGAAASHVVLRVRDNGIGIPAAFLPRLFEKFSQVAPPLNRVEGGLGLGLALVRGIVTLHRGSVEARSEGTGHGSEFIVRLPLAAAETDATGAAATATASSNGGAIGRPRRVLVVDDNEDNVSALEQLLRQQGHCVETARDGEEAYAAAERFRPDVVLLDIGMPRLNGYEVCRRIREQEWGRCMRVIAQTGWGQDADRRRTEEAGFDAHLVKPIDPATLQGMLRE